MIYLDSSAIVKLALHEAESEDFEAYAVGKRTITSAVADVEVRRAVRRTMPEKLVRAEEVLAGIETITVGREVLQLAGIVHPASVRSLDAIHLASALTVRDEIEAFVSYDERLLEAARLAGIPTISPGV